LTGAHSLTGMLHTHALRKKENLKLLPVTERAAIIAQQFLPKQCQYASPTSMHITPDCAFAPQEKWMQSDGTMASQIEMRLRKEPERIWRRY